MTVAKVKVLVYSCPPNQSYLEFELIFPDHGQKYYKLDPYEMRQFRCNDREVFEIMARLYFEGIEEPVDVIELVFL